MSSFLGSRVSVQLRQGGQVQGTISGIDGVTGSLTIQQDLNVGTITITRVEIADLQLLPNVAAAQQNAASSSSGGNNDGRQRNDRYGSNTGVQDPAVVSYASATSAGHSKVASHSPEPKQKSPPTAPAAMQALLSDRGGPGARKGAKGQAKINRTRTPDVIVHGGKGKSGRTLEEGGSDLEEDFDFDKALKTFDKKKVWEEIKTADKSDPRLLLVSHNRKADAETNGQGSEKHRRNAQDKLAWDEPVLSPSPPPTIGQTAVAGGDVSSKADGIDMQNVRTELDRVRGNALQRDIEMSKLRDELQALKSKLAVYESLCGAELESVTVADGTEKWHVTLYDSLASHADARREAAATAGKRLTRGALTFMMSSSVGKLRYLGPVAHKSDDDVVDRLPTQYRGEMGLKPETASLFLRRIKDAIQPPS